MPDAQSIEVTENEICPADESRYTGVRIVAGEHVEGAFPETEIRDKVRAGGEIRGVVVVISEKHGKLTFVPFFRVSWQPKGYISIGLRRGGLRGFSDFSTMLKKLRGDPAGTGEDAGFAYFGPMDVVYPDDPVVEKLGPGARTV